MKEVKAKLYGQCEGDSLQLFKSQHDLLKKHFNGDFYQVHDFEKFSKSLGANVKSKVIIINVMRIFSLFFSDGSVYEAGRGWRNQAESEQQSTAKWVNERFEILKNEETQK